MLLAIFFLLTACQAQTQPVNSPKLIVYVLPQNDEDNALVEGQVRLHLTVKGVDKSIDHCLLTFHMRCEACTVGETLFVKCQDSILDVNVSAGFHRLAAAVQINNQVVAYTSTYFEVLSRDVADAAEDYRYQTSAGSSAALLNSIIEQQGYHSYLEIGVNRRNFENIIANDKNFVQSNRTSGSLLFGIAFENPFGFTGRCFDLIFVNGLHDSEQIDQAIASTLGVVCPGGLVLISGCNPPTARHAARQSHGVRTTISSTLDGGGSQPGKWSAVISYHEKLENDWSGDGWKSIVRQRCKLHRSSRGGRDLSESSDETKAGATLNRVERRASGIISGVIDHYWGLAFLLPAASDDVLQLPVAVTEMPPAQLCARVVGESESEGLLPGAVQGLRASVETDELPMPTDQGQFGVWGADWAEELSEHRDPSWSLFSGARRRALGLISVDSFLEMLNGTSEPKKGQEMEHTRSGRYVASEWGGRGHNITEQVGSSSKKSLDDKRQGMAEGAWVGEERQRRAAGVGECSGSMEDAERAYWRERGPVDILVVYAYLESERTWDSLTFFLNQVLKYDSLPSARHRLRIQYVLVLMDTVTVPIPADVDCLHVIRVPNLRTDFNAYRLVLDACGHELDYDRGVAEDSSNWDPVAPNGLDRSKTLLWDDSGKLASKKRSVTDWAVGAAKASLEAADARLIQEATEEGLQRVCPRMREFRFFFFINSSCRGPFLPPYAVDAGLHWTDPFVNKLSQQVRLAGSSCVFSPGSRPTIEGFVLATDSVGLRVMRKANVFQYYMNKWDAVREGEVGASSAMYSAGFTTACLATQYQGVDMRRPTMELLAELDPWWAVSTAQRVTLTKSPQFVYHLQPYEVVFIKTVYSQFSGFAGMVSLLLRFLSAVHNFARHRSHHVNNKLSCPSLDAETAQVTSLCFEEVYTRLHLSRDT